jgi:hypothetical protein
MKIPNPYRSPGEYTAWLAGVKAMAAATGFDVDADSWGGGIPNEVTVTSAIETEAPPPAAMVTTFKDHDIYTQQAEIADDGDNGESSSSPEE